MADIRHRVGIQAPQEMVYEALAAVEGLSGWWVRDVRGDASPGGKLGFYLEGGKLMVAMEVTELIPGLRVAWRCVDGPAEWIDTHLSFDLTAAPEETVVMFTHADWREPVEFMHHCSTRWAQYLIGLKVGLENGKAFPEVAKISSWS
ncbi:MAG: hypothetical protein QOE54_5073 [Streptosporangiaceae bacterium]|jgi:uncharacterized protein YndB with AHSA1/START domain|nr:Activator of Hsp90 ATPase 1 family protein [Streptosporangiaceae bacterium]MDX6432707.1 hypothetical protein [Streptosporangiaceae bacterium]